MKNQYMMLPVELNWLDFEKGKAFYLERATAGAIIVPIYLERYVNWNQLAELAEGLHEKQCKLFVRLYLQEQNDELYEKAIASCEKNFVDGILLHDQIVEQFKDRPEHIQFSLSAEEGIVCLTSNGQSLKKTEAHMLYFSDKMIHDIEYYAYRKPFLCDANFLESFLADTNYLPCQACGFCESCTERKEPIACTFNPEIGYESFEEKRRKVATRKEILVIGGGLAGMMSAKKSAERGYKTTLITKESDLASWYVSEGGTLEERPLREAYRNRMKEILEQRGVHIVYETICDDAYLLEKKPYFTVFATGDEEHTLPMTLLDKNLSYAFVGEAEKPNSTIQESILSAYLLFHKLYIV